MQELGRRALGIWFAKILYALKIGSDRLVRVFSETGGKVR